MYITVLGSGTLQPTEKRGCPGYLVEAQGSKILLDAGSGCLRQLASIGVLANDIDFIFLSHLHPDHICDLIPVLFAKVHNSDQNNKRIRIFGPHGFKSCFSPVFDMNRKWLDHGRDDIEINEYDGTELKFPDFIISFYPVEHSENSHGIRIESNNSSFAYSGDTGYCSNLVELCKKTDLAVMECTFTDDFKIQGHLTPSEAGRAATEADVKKLLLSHIAPSSNEDVILMECMRRFDGDVSLAEELKRYTV